MFGRLRHDDATRRRRGFAGGGSHTIQGPCQPDMTSGTKTIRSASRQAERRRQGPAAMRRREAG